MKNIKKFIIFILAAALLSAAAAFTASADGPSYTPAAKLQYEIYDNLVAITGCDDDIINLSIPPVIEGRAVTAVADGAFAEKIFLQTAVIPDSVLAIGASAFSGCISLQSLTLPFVGRTRGGAADAALFGYIFGGQIYPNTDAAVQYCSSSGSLTYYIPSALRSVTITDETDISYGAFSGCGTLTSISYNNSITALGERAFAGCTSLSAPPIGAGVLSIGSECFKDCTGFVNITVPATVTSIGKGTFSGCTSLESLTIPFIGNERGINEVASAMFGYIFGDTGYSGGVNTTQYYHQSNLVNYYLPASLTAVTVTDETVIPFGAFTNCSELQSITILRNSLLTEIPAKAFSGCSALSSHSLPSNITAIGEKAYENCSSLPNPVFPASLETIDGLAYYGCSSFRSVTVPNSVLSIGPAPFACCSGITSITLPFIGAERGNDKRTDSVFGYVFGNYNYSGGVSVSQYYNANNQVSAYLPPNLRTVAITDETVIPYGAFCNCSALTSITYPDTVTAVSARAFYNCSGVSTLAIPSHISVIETRTFYNCTGLPATLNIPSNITEIKEEAFLGCISLQTVVVPNSVLKIGSSVFSDCPGITSITLPFIGTERGISGRSDAVFGYIFGTTSYSGGTATVQYHSSWNQYTYYIPSGLRTVRITDETAIPYGAFCNCSALTSITYPDTVTSVGARAFYNCSGVSTLAIPSHISVIETQTFYNCTGLPATLNIPSNITLIEERAFDSCTSLRTVTVPDSVLSMSPAPFAYCSGITSITLPFIGAERGNNGRSDAVFGYVFGNYNYDGAIPVNQYYSANNRASAYLPPNLRTVVITDETVIPYAAFSECSTLTSVTYPDTVTAVGGRAFYNCSGLGSIPIPSGISTIEYQTFYGCTGLPAALNIPSNITEIKDYAFEGCTSLETVVIPESVTKIGLGAFSKCSGITSVTIPFVGTERGNNGRSDAVFGYIFGTTNYEGATAVNQYYSGWNYTTYYLPSDLNSVTVTDEPKIPYGAFSNCSVGNITYNEMLKDPDSMAFYQCAAQVTAVKPINYTNNSGGEITLAQAKQAGSVKINVSLFNPPPQGCVLYIASYNASGAMVDLRIVDRDLSEAFEITYALPQNSDISVIKTIVFNENDLKPVIKAYSLI